MDNHGFIREVLDIKILILFVLSRLSGEVDAETLADLCRADSGFGYFEYSDCLSDLVDTGHVELNENGYLITDKGRKNAEAVSGSLPFSVRSKTLELIKPVEEIIRRRAMIETRCCNEGDSCRVRFTLSDGAGELLSMSFLCSDEDSAAKAESRFRASAEDYYLKIVKMFCED